MKTGRVIENLACNVPLTRDSRFQAEFTDMWHTRGVVSHGIQGGFTRAIVADPKWAAGTETDTPCIDQVCVLQDRDPWQIRHKINLLITLSAVVVVRAGGRRQPAQSQSTEGHRAQEAKWMKGAA